MISQVIFINYDYPQTKELFRPRKSTSGYSREGTKIWSSSKDSNGAWRIISLKTSPAEYWDAHYDTREDAEKALAAYHANKH